MIKRLLLVCTCGLLIFQLKAIDLEGTVTAFGDIPLANVVVSARSGASTLTDENGFFTIVIEEKDVVSFKAKGFTNRKLRNPKSTSLKVNMLLEEGESAKVKAIQNGHINPENLEQGLTTVGFTNYKYSEMSSIYELLRLEHPGIRVDDQSNSVFLVNQGRHTFGSSIEALLILDGSVVNDISMILPTQVKQVRVHQGADAAQWGARGANGVIEIELLEGSTD